MSREKIIRQTIYLCLNAGYGINHVARVVNVSVNEVKEIAKAIAKHNTK